MRLNFDLRDFRRITRRLGALESQIPFALAQALNASAEAARRELIDTTWAQNIRVRNPSFLKAALTTKGARATKRSLRVEVYDRLGRGSLLLHDQGGSKRPRGASLAVPAARVAARRSGKGVPSGLRPKALPNSFVTDGRRPNTHLVQGAIYQRQGAYRAAGTIKSSTGKRRKKPADFRTVKLMYVLKPSAPIRADVPFGRDFARVMRREMPRQFGAAMTRAMATAFRR